jgi:hypothetical protein
MKALFAILALALITSACGNDVNPMQASGTSHDHNQKQTAGSTVSILD